MDFEAESWDVSAEASELNNSLFSFTPSLSNKKKKKILGSVSAKGKDILNNTKQNEKFEAREGKRKVGNSTKPSKSATNSSEISLKKLNKRNKYLGFGKSTGDHSEITRITQTTETTQSHDDVEKRKQKKKLKVFGDETKTSDKEESSSINMSGSGHLKKRKLNEDNLNGDEGIDLSSLQVSPVKKKKKKKVSTDEIDSSNTKKKNAISSIQVNPVQEGNQSNTSGLLSDGDTNTTDKSSNKKKRKKRKNVEVEENELTNSSPPKKKKVIDDVKNISHGDHKDSSITVGENSEVNKKKRKRKCRKNKFKPNETPAEDMESNFEKVTASKNVNKNTDTLDEKFTELKKRKKKKEIAEAEKLYSSDKKKKQKKLNSNDSKEINSSESNTKFGNKNKKIKEENIHDETNNTKPNTKMNLPFSSQKMSKTYKNSESETNEIPPQNSKERPDKGPQKKSLLQVNLEKLEGARFRFINEQLYVRTGEEAFQLFKEDPYAFEVYHKGFQNQVEKWPVNPLDVIIEYVKSKPSHKVVADFGCGDARLAQSVPNKVYSFDLVALNNRVTVCDIAKVPLSDGTIDTAVFCLSLMGTNFTAYLREANRVLKKGGVLMIAEVASRFGKVTEFVHNVESMGFHTVDEDTENRMFVLMKFQKKVDLKDKLVKKMRLKPCVYKKR